eukprot:879416-Pyramimonas_sp.AAC.1
MMRTIQDRNWGQTSQYYCGSGSGSSIDVYQFQLITRAWKRGGDDEWFLVPAATVVAKGIVWHGQR